VLFGQAQLQLDIGSQQELVNQGRDVVVAMVEAKCKFCHIKRFNEPEEFELPTGYLHIKRFNN
jgi:hypothetical protein